MALSVARSLVTSATNKATSEAMDEVALLMGVRAEIWYIKHELRIMQAFLRAAERMKDRDELVKVWAEQVEDLSYDIKYCLDEFKFNLGQPGCFQWLTKLRVRHQIAVQIRNLKVRVGEVSNMIQRYSHLMMPITSSSTEKGMDDSNSYMEYILTQSASGIYESQLIGFSKSKEELIELMDIDTMDGLAKVIFITGWEGLGKTTLARKIYESNIVNNFSCCAWITVSRSCSKIEILKDLTKQILGGEYLQKCLEELEGKALQVEDIASCLRGELKHKRYFIILDDLWGIDALEWIKDVTSPDINYKGSLILVTTQDPQIGMMSTSKSLIYHLKPIEIDDAISWLLRKTLVRRVRTKEGEARSMLLNILVQYGGFPLAILIVGGMLATINASEWESIDTKLPSFIELTVDSNLGLRKMVIAAYNHLPSHLKPCFLYLCLFPVDFEIQTRRLIDRWIAEGLITSKIGMDIEDVAMSYFYELTNRCLIQPSRVNVEGRVKSCRVSGFISDTMASVSRQEKFVYLTYYNKCTRGELPPCSTPWSEVSKDWHGLESCSIIYCVCCEPHGASTFTLFSLPKDA